MKTNCTKNYADVCEMSIRAACHTFLDESWHHNSSCSPFSRLYYVKDGEGFLRIDGREIKMQGGYVYFIPAECVIDYGCTSLEKIFFHISVKTLDNYDLFSNLKEIYELPFEEDLYYRLLECYNPQSYQDVLKLKMLVLGTVMEFQSVYGFDNVPIQQYSDVVKETFGYIHRNLKINLKAAEIADYLFVSESKLRNMFKKEMDMPIGHYIEDMVFIKAKKLLENTNLSIGEISSRLGFYDRFHFSRRFKEKFNQSPAKFKKSSRFMG